MSRLDKVDFNNIHEEAGIYVTPSQQWPYYDKYQMGKYATINCSAVTARKFKPIFPSINESTVLELKKEG